MAFEAEEFVFVTLFLLAMPQFNHFKVIYKFVIAKLFCHIFLYLSHPSVEKKPSLMTQINHEVDLHTPGVVTRQVCVMKYRWNYSEVACAAFSMATMPLFVGSKEKI